MNDIRNITIGILAIVIAILGYSVHVPTSVPSQKAGSVASPDIMSPYFSFGGVRHWGGKTDALYQATSTQVICALRSPNATSTLMSASIELDVSSSSASVLTLAKSADGIATTTVMNHISVAAGAQALLVATSSSISADGTTGTGIFAPNQYLVGFMQNTTTGGTFTPSGECVAFWQEI